MLKSFIVILLIYCPFINSAQEKAVFIETYNFKDLSPKGQDTLFYHYSTNKKLFKLETDLFEKIPYPEIKIVFEDYFRDRLNANDLEIVLDHWDKKQAEFVFSTLDRVIPYQNARACQKRLVDSLLHLYNPLLRSYFPQVKKELSPEEIELLLHLQEKNRAKLSYKRKVFLGHEEKFTIDIDSSIWQYMKFGFDLMEKVPSSKYFNLLGADNSSLSFLKDRNLKDYYDLYEKFESDLIQGLDSPGCRAHVAIPFYVNENQAAVERIHTIRNSIFFFIQSDSSLQQTISRGDTNRTIQMIDSIDLKIFDSTARIDSFISRDKIKAMGFHPMKMGNAISFLIPNKGNTPIIAGFELIKTEQQKKDMLKSIRNPNTGKKMELLMLGKQKIYYSVSAKEDRHTLKVEKGFDGFTIINDELIQIGLYGIGATREQFEQYLQFLKYP